jgi:hypothetical protein
MIIRMDTPRRATGDPTVCARRGCENPVTQPPGGRPPRRYCSDACRSAERRSRASAGPAEIVCLSVVQEEGEAGPVAELLALSARLAQIADAVDGSLVDAEVDAVSARVASVEAVAAEHLAERHAADERQAGLAAEEAAEVAEDLRDEALAEAAALATRVLETEVRAAAEVAHVRTLLDAERNARVAAQSEADALTGQRDRLVAQLAAQADRDAGLVSRLRRAPSRGRPGHRRGPAGSPDGGPSG